MPSTPLYEANGVSIARGDFVRAMSELGLGEGDVVFVHSDVSVFGKLKTQSRSTLMQELCSAIAECVGDKGTIIMPAFTYSFFNGEVFDPVHSRSTVGALTEYFRQQPGVLRSHHPAFSVAAWGARKEFFTRVGRDSCGPDSIFHKLHQSRGKLLFLGAPFQSCTYLHYVEQEFGVPYRSIKEFSGVIRDGNEERQETCTFFVRRLDQTVNFTVSRIEKILQEKKLAREICVGAGRLLMVDSGVLFDEATKLLREDLYGLLEAPPA